MATTVSEERNNQQIKRDRFLRIAERRVNRLLDDLDSLGKCANRANYKYTVEDIKKIFGELDKKTKEIKLLFQTSTERRNRFKLL